MSISHILVSFILMFGTLLNISIILRIVFNWFNVGSSMPLARLMFEITEPILGPIRRLLPQTFTIDFSPLVALLIIQFASTAIASAGA